jgi:hypothetical protein
MIGWEIRAEDVWDDPGENRCTVRVAGTNGQISVLERSLPRESSKDLGSHRGGNAEIIDRDEHTGSAGGFIAQREGFGMKSLSDARVRVSARAVATEPNWVLGCNIAFSGTYGEQG